MARDFDDDPAELLEREGEDREDEDTRVDRRLHEAYDEGLTNEDIRLGRRRKSEL